jgi:hypothetical protein
MEKAEFFPEILNLQPIFRTLRLDSSYPSIFAISLANESVSLSYKMVLINGVDFKDADDVLLSLSPLVARSVQLAGGLFIIGLDQYGVS